MERRKHEALSIPNLITYFRLLLIPAFVAAYFEGRYGLALLTLVVSGLSDVADGYIARHYNMVTDIGKVVDPVADKLTQAAMIFCVAWNVPSMWVLLGLLAVKEVAMLVWGWYTLRRTGTVNSAKWYGKVCTGVLYASMAIFVLWPDIPGKAANIITAVCAGVMVMSIVLYSRWYIRFLRGRSREDKPEPDGAARGAAHSHTSVILLEVMAVVVLVAAILAIVYRNDLTLDSILSFTPSNLWLAALVFLGLYALKSVVAVVYLKLLYIAAGMVFPLPVAIAVNIAGTAVEMTLPYLLGRYGGKKTMELILERKPKLQRVQDLRSTNNFRFSALCRAVGVLPAEPLSIYLGASGMPYAPFVLGGVAGLLPSMLITTIMGTQVEDPTSPGFIISTTLFIVIQLSAAAGFTVWGKKQHAAQTGDEKEQSADESAE